MAQVKFFGLREALVPRRQLLSDVVHGVVMEVLGLPPGKRAHRFFCLDEADFIMPQGRSSAYTIVEIMLMAGRTVETRKRLVRRLFEVAESDVGIAPQDLEICLLESPAENWGFRGLHGDEAVLPYDVKR